MNEITLRTADGTGRAFTFAPKAEGVWPGVVFFMDGFGIRPTLFRMGERLARHGYVVVMPDLFWRTGAYEPADAAAIFADQDKRQAFSTRFAGAMTPSTGLADAEASLEHLSRHPQVALGPYGVTGYCMGGGLALRAAATFPDKIAAAASFHGGRLATDAPDSPHLLAASIRARVLVAGADADPSFPPDQGDRLREALSAAGVVSEVTIYPGAGHGYTMDDLPVYNPGAAERHWLALTQLFDATLDVRPQS